MSREGSEVVLYEIVRGVIHWHRIFPLYCRSVRWPSTFFLLLKEMMEAQYYVTLDRVAKCLSLKIS